MDEWNEAQDIQQDLSPRILAQDFPQMEYQGEQSFFDYIGSSIRALVDAVLSLFGLETIEKGRQLLPPAVEAPPETVTETPEKPQGPAETPELPMEPVEKPERPMEPIEKPQEPTEKPEHRPDTHEFNETCSDRAAEVMAEVFDRETLENWGRMSAEQRYEKVQAYYGKLYETLGIEGGSIVFEDLNPGAPVDLDLGRQGKSGYAREGDANIHLDIRLLANPSLLGDMLDTVTHETRHQLQYAAIADPERFIAEGLSPELIHTWEVNMINYNSGEWGFEGYYTQAVEADARVFAADVLDRYCDILGLN